MKELLLKNIKKLKIEISEISPNVEIIAATKGQSVDSINFLHNVDENITMAENRVQEFIRKFDECASIKWDFIGRLQTNKVKYLIGKVRYIQSVDRIELLNKIDIEAAKKNLVQECFVQINAGDEDSKAGIKFQECEGFLKKAIEMNNVKICGIMVMTPIAIERESLINYFIEAKRVFDENKKNYNLKYLSMGMSNDYIQAIKYGSNMIRVGQSLFGPREFCGIANEE